MIIGNEALKGDLMKSKQSIKAKFEEYIEEKQKDKPLFQKAFMHKSHKVTLPHYKTNETLVVCRSIRLYS